MKVKELINALQEQPQDAEVYYMNSDGGLIQTSNVKKAVPGNDETKEVIGDEFVLIE